MVVLTLEAFFGLGEYEREVGASALLRKSACLCPWLYVFVCVTTAGRQPRFFPNVILYDTEYMRESRHNYKRGR